MNQVNKDNASKKTTINKIKVETPTVHQKKTKPQKENNIQKDLVLQILKTTHTNMKQFDSSLHTLV